MDVWFEARVAEVDSVWFFVHQLGYTDERGVIVLQEIEPLA